MTCSTEKKPPTSAWLKADKKRTAMNEGRFKIVSDDYTATIYTAENNLQQPVAIFYQGRQTKPKKVQAYLTEDQRDDAIKKFIDECKKQKSDSFFSNENIEIGQVFYTSWGYDQTNVEHYKVIGLIGKTMVEIVEIGTLKEHQDIDYGTCLPAVDNVIGKPIRRKVHRWKDKASIRMDYVRTAFFLEKDEEGNYLSKSWSSYR